jgi:hypothetical protein
MRQISKMALTPLARQKSGPAKGPYLSCAAQLLLDLNKADGGAGSHGFNIETINIRDWIAVRADDARATCSEDLKAEGL